MMMRYKVGEMLKTPGGEVLVLIRSCYEGWETWWPTSNSYIKISEHVLDSYYHKLGKVDGQV